MLKKCVSKKILRKKKNSSIFPTQPPPIAPNRRNVESSCTLQKKFQPFSAKPILLTNTQLEVIHSILNNLVGMNIELYKCTYVMY